MEEVIVQPSPPGPSDQQVGKRVKMRNFLAFWLLGLCNQYGFAIMLSAAYDILDEKEAVLEEDLKLPAVMFNQTNGTLAERFDCHSFSTGAVLLAAVLPIVINDITAPWYADYIPFGIRNAICVVASASSFLIVGLNGTDSVAFSLTGVVFSGISLGLGEFTYISLMAFYDKNAVSAWSSGTGAAGLIAALSYAGLTEVLTPRNTVLVMLTVPVLMFISYWGVLVRVPTSRLLHDDHGETEQQPPNDNAGEIANESAQDSKSCETKRLTIRERFRYLKHLMKYIIPLMLAAFALYFVNQGLLELIYFQGIFLTHEEQYRWFQVLVQLGAFLSRSSVNIIKIKRLWVFPLLQWGLLVLVFTEAYFAYIPNIFIVFAIVLCVGLPAGASYVNTFYQIRENEGPKYKEFAMGATIMATSIGVTLSGVIALPVHDALCRA